MPPVPRVRYRDALNPVDLQAAGGAVQEELADAPFEFGLGLQEFQSHIFAATVTG